MRSELEYLDRLEYLGSDGIDAIDTNSKELPAAKRFPVSAMPQGCKRLIEEAAAAIGCPPEFVALPMLAVLGSAIGNSWVLRLKDGWEEGASIFAAVIADPGEKKTPAYKVAIEPAVKEQASFRADYRRAADDFKREQRKYDVDKRDAHKAGEPAPPPPKPPVMERTVVEDTTVEALASVLEGTPRGVLAVRDELAGWVRAMDQYKQGGKGADRQFYLSAWSSSYVAVDRKNRSEPLILTRPFISVFGSIQPSVLGDLASGREDGLLDRFLFAYPDPVPSRWTDAEISEDARGAYQRLYVALRDMHIPEDSVGDPDPVRVHLTKDAKDVLIDAINAHREEMDAVGFPARLKGPWSKLEAYLARLCLILAAARSAFTGAAERAEKIDVLAAVVLVGYFKNHARRVYVGLYGEDRDDLLAADVAEFLKQRGGHFKDEPAVLFDELNSGVKPPRADELTKRLKTIAAKTKDLHFEICHFWKEGQSRRCVELFLNNGVNGVKGDNGA
jgi:putative DNA primase/helicase